MNCGQLDMSHKTKKLHSNPLPSELETSAPSRDSRNPVSYEEWITKNAQAKALIMSTLVPGSEAWRIAEPLEIASDIMRALEAKYGPKSDANKARQPDTLGIKRHEVVEDAQRLDRKDQVPNLSPNRQTTRAVASGNGVGESASKVGSQAHPDMKPSPVGSDVNQEGRDMRLLWALLNGGKGKPDAVTI
jgi:hypothetical protein